MTKKILKKAQKGSQAGLSDSIAYYKNQERIYRQLAKSEKGDTKVSKFNKDFFESEAGKAVSDQLRQYHKGAPGFDKLGNPIKKKMGGAIKVKKIIKKK